jgi:cell wall-associated NlpC family hydrolase
MFVLDRAKARAAALVLTSVAGVQMWPTAHAVPNTTTINEAKADNKAPKKLKKKAADGPTVEDLEEQDPLDVLFAFARKQIGKPYRWGATGPNAFDCSGFTGYVYRKIGVELPRTSSGQRAGTKHISLENMKPGDLIFSSGHVGLYLGKGKMIHSPHSGRTVSIDPVHSRAYGAGRPKVK